MTERVVKLPVRAGVPAQSFGALLAWRRYTIALDWIGRIDRWSISISTADGTPVASRLLVTGADVLRQVRARPEAPQGVLSLVDVREAGREATLDSLGRDDGHVLIFVSV